MSSVTDHSSDPGESAEPTRAVLTGLRGGEWLDQQTFDPLRYAVHPILPEGTNLLVGAPKVGKSMFVLSLALGCAYGGKALSLAADHRRVLYLALEDSDRRMQARCRHLLAGEPIPPDFYYLTSVTTGGVIDTVAAWLDEYSNGSPALIILDTLGKVMPPALPGETTYGRDYRIGSVLHRTIIDHPGSTLVICHHNRKAQSDDFVDAVSGSNGLAGASDTILLLTRPRFEENGMLSVTGRDVVENEYALTYHDQTWSLDGGSANAAAAKAAAERASSGLGPLAVDIVAYVCEGVSPTRPSDLVEHFDIDIKTASTYLSRLAAKDRITRVGRGLYAARAPQIDKPEQLDAWPAGSIGAAEHD